MTQTAPTETVDQTTGEIIPTIDTPPPEVESDDIELEDFNLNPRTLIGNVRDAILDTIKAEKENKSWAQMPAKEQSALIDRCTSVAENLVRKCVSLIASRGFTTIGAQIDSATMKKGKLKIVLESVVTESNVLSLANGGSDAVFITFADPDSFDQYRTPNKPDPDQPGLALDGTNDEDAEFDTDEDFNDTTEDPGTPDLGPVLTDPVPDNDQVGDKLVENGN